MAEPKTVEPYEDIPGTQVFDAKRSRDAAPKCLGAGVVRKRAVASVHRAVA